MCTACELSENFVFFLFFWLCNCVFFITGFAFVYFEDERDAEDAINALDNTAFGYDRRRLSVEWARVCRVFVKCILILFSAISVFNFLSSYFDHKVM